MTRLEEGEVSLNRNGALCVGLDVPCLNTQWGKLGHDLIQSVYNYTAYCLSDVCYSTTSPEPAGLAGVTCSLSPPLLLLLLSFFFLLFSSLPLQSLSLSLPPSIIVVVQLALPYSVSYLPPSIYSTYSIVWLL